MANISNHNFNSFPIDGTMRSQTQYNLFAKYLSEGFRTSAAKSLPGDVSIFGFFFAILNLLACISAGVLLLIWVMLSGLFKLILIRNKPAIEDDVPITFERGDYTSEEIDYYLSDEYAKIQDETMVNEIN